MSLHRALHDSGHAAARARKLAAYLAVVVAGVPRRRVAQAMGRDHAVVVRACAEVEAMSDAHEAEIERLARAYQALLWRLGIVSWEP